MMEALAPGIERHNQLNQQVEDAMENGAAILAEEPVAEAAEAAEAASDTESATPEKWFWAEGVEGVGEKPDFYNEKTFRSVAEQAKAQPELRKILGEVPKEYALSLSEDNKDFVIADDDPFLASFKESAKSSLMSQEGFNSSINTYVTYVRSIEEQNAQTAKAELEKIGPKAQERLESIEQWALNAFEGSWDVEIDEAGNKSMPLFQAIVSNAKILEGFEKIRDGGRGPSVQNVSNAASSKPSLDDLNKLLNHPDRLRMPSKEAEAVAAFKAYYG